MNTTTADLPELRDRAHQVIKSDPSGTVLVKALEVLALISRTQTMQLGPEAMSSQAVLKIVAKLAERVAELEVEAATTTKTAQEREFLNNFRNITASAQAQGAEVE